MYLAQGPQRSDAARPFDLDSSTLPLSHCAPNYLILAISKAKVWRDMLIFSPVQINNHLFVKSVHYGNTDVKMLKKNTHNLADTSRFVLPRIYTNPTALSDVNCLFSVAVYLGI